MRLRIVAVIGVLVALLVGVTSAGAAVGGPRAKAEGRMHKLDLSSMTKIRHYLRSIGVDPSTVVIQRGHRNYAGPRCPGKGWNCTKATRVVQIATASGQNQFTCTPSTTGTDPNGPTCVVMQPGPGNNQAQCYETSSDPTATEACIITQTGDVNMAIVHQEINQKDGTTQAGNQIADVKQFAASKNDSEIYQSIDQNESTGSSQAQDGHQLAQVAQYISGGSENFSHVHQTQSQKETGNALTQTQNTGTAPTDIAPLGGTPYDFDCGGAQEPANPNQCANVCQASVTSGGGFACGSDLSSIPVDNESHLHQAVAETESTSNPLVTEQTQGDPANGQKGEIHQENPVGFGLNHNHGLQSLGQREVAPGIETGTHQHQLTDPGCCGFSQFGGSDNLEAIDQSTDMSATGNFAQQNSRLLGHAQQTDTPPNPGAPTPLATATPPAANDLCSIDQHGRTNSGGDEFSVRSQDPVLCADLNLVTVCNNQVEGNAPSCTAPQCIDSCGIPVGITSLVPTYGQDITMPTFDDPADWGTFTP